jgi:hypothetical protein
METTALQVQINSSFRFIQPRSLLFKFVETLQNFLIRFNPVSDSHIVLYIGADDFFILGWLHLIDYYFNFNK